VDGSFGFFLERKNTKMWWWTKRVGETEWANISKIGRIFWNPHFFAGLGISNLSVPKEDFLRNDEDY
jgi:hypothetical protein